MEIVGFENRDGDSPLRGITATPLSEELGGELSGPSGDPLRRCFSRPGGGKAVRRMGGGRGGFACGDEHVGVKSVGSSEFSLKIYVGLIV